MDWLAAVFALFFLNVVALVMAANVDGRTRRRIRAGELPPCMPWLLMWWPNGGIDPFYLFSSMFPRMQDRTTSWLVWPLRIIVGGTLLAITAVILFLGFQIWLKPA